MTELFQILQKTQKILEKKYSELLPVFEKYKNRETSCPYSHSFLDAYWRIFDHLRRRNLGVISEGAPLPKFIRCFGCKGRLNCSIWALDDEEEREKIEKISLILKRATLSSLKEERFLKRKKEERKVYLKNYMKNYRKKKKIETTWIKKLCSNCKTFFRTLEDTEFCSPECEREYPRCIICGFSETVDFYLENRKKFLLCPNHRALTIGKKINLKETLESIGKGYLY